MKGECFSYNISTKVKTNGHPLANYSHFDDSTRQMHIRTKKICIFFTVFSCDQAALWMVQSVRLSVRLSVRPSHLFDYVPIIISSWNFQTLLLVTKVTSMQKVAVRGQRSRSQRSWPLVAVSGVEMFNAAFSYFSTDHILKMASGRLCIPHFIP